MTDPAVDYKSTLNLPRTDFPMKANLQAREPERLARWEATDLYGRVLESHRNDPKWTLHDGPPYANGDIHMGHALNKTLKDFIVRYQTMKGHFVRYVPGFDCHGLPIEQKALEKLGEKTSQKDPLEIRRICHEFATKYIGLQTSQFKRLGVCGIWDKPYLTLDPKVESRALTLLRDLVEGGYVYKGYKPIYWDPIFQTALAEAEIEYQEHTSPSIYVRFPCLDPEKSEALKGVGAVNFVIWTTTPWTLPANLAVCLHPDFEYVVAEVAGGERVIAAESLLHAFCAEAGLGEPKIIAKFKGAAVEGLHCSHPLLDKQSRVILGDHVTLEQGTGCVHTAPGHGADDYAVGQKYDLGVVQPVDEAGKYTDDYPPLKGVNVWAANPKIIEELKTRGLLVHAGTIRHQYPYSWRSHKPIIVRATEQWFLRVDHEGLRERILKAIDTEVRWIPRWGRDRIYNMIAGRPDWCLSRQRAWGMPIPSVYSKKERKSLLLPEVMTRFIAKVAEFGTDCWYTLPLSEFLPAGYDAADYEKEFDILDVWFDSGATHASVLEADPELNAPAQMYLEGSDQHRGWFHSSLITSVAARNRAPYEAVLTHGFLLDEKGDAMSKSKGNVISPLDIMKDKGADILRLWVASEDYRDDLKISKEIMERVAEAYRRIRNTFRYMLGNLADFTPANAVASEAMIEIDRWAMAKLDELVEKAIRAYDDYEFHRVYHLCNAFCVEMSAAYLDVIKDRLYCSAPDDRERRSAQTAMHEIFSTMTRLLAPIIPFTADEAWEAAFGEGQSVHLQAMPAPRGLAGDAALLARWERLAEAREVVARKLEEARREKRIGASLEARVSLRPRGTKLFESLAADPQLLCDVFIVSQCGIESGGDAPDAMPLEEALEVTIGKPEGKKCERCWKILPEVGATDGRELCGRCADVVDRIQKAI